MAHLSGISWVKPEAMHLTLNFLGDDTPADQVRDILQQMEKAAKGIAPFSIAIKGVTAFPDLKRPRVVVSEIDGEAQILSTLKNNLDRSLSSLGFPMETRPFKGHLTLGRIKNRIDPVMFRKRLSGHTAFQTRAFEAVRMTLFRSELRPSGPRYHELGSIEFPSL